MAARTKDPSILDAAKNVVTDARDVFRVFARTLYYLFRGKREKGEAYETKRNITVGQIRSMQQRLTTRPTLGSRRVIIINPADDMEKSASNALLKSLEEPPKAHSFC